MNKQVDWIIHYVTEHHGCEVCGTGPKEPKDYYGFDGFANIHTHGLTNHGQREICVAIDIGGDVAMSVINSMGIQVLNGETVYTEGIRADVLQGDYDVKFISFDNDPTLYMILPDPNNKFPGDEGCQHPYDKQEWYAQIISDDKGYV
jgi:hypothetical protein